MGAGAQKSGGAAALPAPPPPRSLNYCVEGKLGSDYQVFQKMQGLRNWDCTVVSFS